MRYVVSTALLCCLLALSNLPPSYAEVPHSPITSSGLNTAISDPINLPNNSTQYNITGGTRPGGGTNLFHSFGDFRVPTNSIANFLNSGSVDLAGYPLAAGLLTNNILGRITAGDPSVIFGMIQTNGTGGFSNANLFLMNPAGFLFGPNATINVGGMVAFTTADYLRLEGVGGNGIFYADTTQTSVLTSVPVAAFGFLGSNPAAIAIQGSILTVAPGQSISLVGGNGGFDYTDPDTGLTAPASVPDRVTMTGGILSASGGQINLASVASPGEMLLAGLQSVSNINGQSFTTMGNITLSQSAMLDVSADAAGTIRIRGGQFELINSALNADTANSHGSETAIDIHLTGNLSIASDNSPALTARSFGDGNAGEISAISTKMKIVSTLPEDVALIDTHTEGAGNGGNVCLTTGELEFTGNPGGGDFFIMSGTAGGGNGGNVTIHADTVHLQEARIDTGDATLGGGGSGGDVTFTGGDMIFDFVSIVTDSLNAIGGNILLNGRDITITNESSVGPLSLFGQSTVTINARNFALKERSIIFNQTALGTGGGITITSENAEFSNGSRVFSQTSGDADAGFIKLVATGHVTFADTFDGPPVPRSGLFTQSLGDTDLGTHGNAGAIDVSVGSLTITGGARIDSSTQTNGKGGAITIAATDGVSITGERPLGAAPESRASGIYTRTFGSELCAGPCGNAGSVTISSSSLNLGDGGTINSNTTNNGVGGNITVNAANTITVSGTMIDGTPSGIFSRTIGTASDSGAGGNIALTAGHSVTMSDGASISASSAGPSNAGNISINAGQQFEMRNSSVKTEAAQASGGNIDIQAMNLIRLVDSTISTSVFGGAGSGGDITIDPNVFVMQISDVIAKAVQGAGGNITITTPLFLADSSSLVSASSLFGLNGTVTIQSPTSNLSGSVGTLPSDPSQAQSLLTQRCAALANGQASSFVVAGREQLPADPGGWLTSPIALAGLDTDPFKDGIVAESTSHLAPRTPALLATDRVSLRRLTPSGLLIANFADSEATGCHS